MLMVSFVHEDVVLEELQLTHGEKKKNELNSITKVPLLI